MWYYSLAIKVETHLKDVLNSPLKTEKELNSLSLSFLYKLGDCQ